MLKKAGIVVAAAAAGLLAMSPLAFAGDHGKGHGHGYDQTNTAVESSEGLVNISDINANVPVQALNCNEVDLGLVPVDVERTTASLTGALALLGTAESESVTVVDNSCNSTQGANSQDAVSQGNDD